MYAFDKTKAEKTLGSLQLTETERVFCAWWLDLMEAGQSIYTRPPTSDIADSLVTFEVYDGAAYWLSVGARVAQEFNTQLVGLDYVKMAPRRDRATRLERMTTIANGALGQQQRSVVSRRGRVHFVRELTVPYGRSGAGHPRTMTYVGVDTEASLGGVDIAKGVMNLAATYLAHPIG